MHQGLSFYQLWKLLKTLKIFNDSQILERLVLYAPHIHIQTYSRINSETITKQYKQNKIEAQNCSTRRDDRVDIKKAKNGAKTTKI
jgi:hypothetical protein